MNREGWKFFLAIVDVSPDALSLSSWNSQNFEINAHPAINALFGYMNGYAPSIGLAL